MTLQVRSLKEVDIKRREGMSLILQSLVPNSLIATPLKSDLQSKLKVALARLPFVISMRSLSLWATAMLD